MFKLKKKQMGIGDWGLWIWTQSPIPKLIFYIIFPPKKMAADNKYRKPGKKSK